MCITQNTTRNAGFSLGQAVQNHFFVFEYIGFACFCNIFADERDFSQRMCTSAKYKGKVLISHHHELQKIFNFDF